VGGQHLGHPWTFREDGTQNLRQITQAANECRMLYKFSGRISFQDILPT
jgi:hypothetical protein